MTVEREILADLAVSTTVKGRRCISEGEKMHNYEGRNTSSSNNVKPTKEHYTVVVTKEGALHAASERRSDPC